MLNEERLVIPTFQSEAEEANWLDSNQDLIAERFALAAAAGRLGNGRVAAKARSKSGPNVSPTLTIRIAKDDLAKARVLAARKGLRYQTYLRMLIHEGLDRDQKAMAG